MSSIKKLLENNQRWAEEAVRQDPDFFDKLAHQQSPSYLWIGCSDSRVPANQITGLLPGEVFVHRNVANLVVHTDLNCLSVLQYAVEVLKVKDVIVCGHYGCGGVRAALEGQPLGLIENWLRHIQDAARHRRTVLENLSSHEQKVDRLCELNVIEQALNVAETTVIEAAWARKQNVTIHGWIYDIKDGRLRDLKVSMSGEEDLKRLRAV
jgi:carbonic anhydrase